MDRKLAKWSYSKRFGEATRPGRRGRQGLAKKYEKLHRRISAPGNRERDPRQNMKQDGKTGEDRSIKGCHRADAESGRQAPRKQRHTAHRIWTRLREENPRFSGHRRCRCGGTHGNGSRNSAAGSIRAAKLRLGPGSSGGLVQKPWQNWRASPRKLQLLRRCRAWRREDAFRGNTHTTQQALLEAHELAFAYFSDVFRTLRYDNMGSLVKKILRGRQRIETDRVIAFRSHWGYQSEHCGRPAKGNDEGRCGRRARAGIDATV